MKVIIAGTRGINDYKLVTQAVERSGYKITEVVCGQAVGVDTLGEQWARMNDVPLKMMPADWGQFGNKAGPMRNRQMSLYADAAIIIWDGESRGTRNMIDNMVRRGKPYFLQMTASTLEDFI